MPVSKKRPLDDGIVTLSKNAITAGERADEAMKTFAALVEAKRIQYRITTSQYANLLGMSSAAYYEQCFQSKNHPYGIAQASALLRFCYIFGYNLNFPGLDETGFEPETRKDIDALKLTSLMVTLPDEVLKEICSTIVNSDNFESEKDRAQCGKLLNSIIYGPNENEPIKWNKNMFGTKSSKKWLEYAATETENIESKNAEADKIAN